MTGEPENWPIRVSNRGEALERHPLSAIFPDMLPEEFQGLVDSIDDHGQLDPVILYEGMVLDGWQRVLACRTLSILPKTAQLPEGEDPKAWVLSDTVYRKDLDAAERQAAISAVDRWHDEQYVKSMVAVDAQRVVNDAEPEVPPDLPVEAHSSSAPALAASDVAFQAKRILKLADIRLDGGTQCRAKLNEDVVAQYAEALMARAEFPPPVVYFDGTHYWLAEGFHRVHANLKIGAVSMEIEARSGSRRDAVLFGVGANQDHGLQRTNADKRKAVEILLADEEWKKWSDREIAKRVGVVHSFVGSVRADFSVDSESTENETRTYITKHGTEAQQVVKKKPKAADPEQVASMATPIPAPTSGPVTVTKLEPAAAVQLQPAAASDLNPAPTPALAPAPKPAPADAELTLQQEYDSLVEQFNEQGQLLKETIAENEHMGAVFDADDHLKAAMARIKQLEAENDTLRTRMAGLMSEKNQAIDAAKRWKRKAEGK